MSGLPNVEFTKEIAGIPIHVEAIVHEDGDVEIQCAWVETHRQATATADAGINTHPVDLAALSYMGFDLEEVLRDEAEDRYNEAEKERAHA